MNSNNRQLVIILALNIILGVTLLIGVHKTISILHFVSTLTISSATEIFSTLEARFIEFMRLDIKLIAGIFFSLFVVFYDVYLIIHWFTSFKFTSKKSCKSCSKHLIREQRVFADHVISAVVPVKRYRCVGCGQNYLKMEKSSGTHDHVADSATETVHVRS